MFLNIEMGVLETINPKRKPYSFVRHTLLGFMEIARTNAVSAIMIS